MAMKADDIRALFLAGLGIMAVALIYAVGTWIGTVWS